MRRAPPREQYDERVLRTPLHQLLGVDPGPLTEQMIDAAIAQGLVESDRLDWKRRLPPERGFKTSDIIKDIAAFANSGGGMLIIGVEEEEKAASGRIDADDLNESYQRTIQAVSYSAISLRQSSVCGRTRSRSRVVISSRQSSCQPAWTAPSDLRRQ